MRAMYLLLALLLPTGAIAAERIVATWDGGQLTEREYDLWVDRLALMDSPGLRRANIQRIVALELLASDYADGRSQLSLDERMALLKLELRERANLARQQLRERLAIAPEDVERALAESPRFAAKPERRLLYNIFLKYPEQADAEARTLVDQRLENIREHIQTLDDFKRLAREYSQSQSRWQGGNMGVVSADQLAPGVAAIVNDLDEGELSEVLKVETGATLFYCKSIIPPRQLTPQEAYSAMEERLRKEAWATEAVALADRLTRKYPLRRTVNPDGSVQIELVGRQFTQEEASYLAGEALPADLPVPVIAEKLRPMHLNLAVIEHAESLGLATHIPDLDQRKGQRLTEYRGVLELGRRVDEVGFEPEESELRAQYAARPGRYKASASYSMNLLIVPPGKNRRATLARAERFAAQIRERATTFEAIAAEQTDLQFEPASAERRITEFRLFGLDPDLVRALGVAGDGEVIVVETDRHGAWVMQRIKRFEAQMKPFEDVREHVLEDVVRKQREALAQSIEVDLVEGVNLRVHGAD